MATASLDNSIIFWNIYNAKEGKRIKIPSEIIQGETIQAIRFASRESNDFLFVLLSSGDLFILETQSEMLIEPPDFESNKVINSYSFCRVPKFAVLDIKKRSNQSNISGAEELWILSVQESGRKGSLHVATFADPK